MSDKTLIDKDKLAVLVDLRELHHNASGQSLDKAVDMVRCVMAFLPRLIETAERAHELQDGLDDAHNRINAIGGAVWGKDTYGKGVNDTVEQALTILEAVGASDPMPRIISLENENKRLKAELAERGRGTLEAAE